MRLLLISLLLAAPGCGRAWERDNGVPLDRADLPLSLEPLQSGSPIWVIQDYNYFQTNSVMFVHPDGAWFFDAGWTYKSARQILWKAAANTYGDFLGLVITSFPLHHTGGLLTFQSHGVKIVGHRYTEPLLRKHWLPMQQSMQRTFDSWRVFDLVRPNGVYGKSFSIMDGRIRVIHVGGYSPDASVVLFRDERVLYAGSLIADPLMFMEYTDFEQYEQALDAVEALEFDTIIAGHGKAVHDRSIINKVRFEVGRLKRAAEGVRER